MRYLLLRNLLLKYLLLFINIALALYLSGSIFEELYHKFTLINISSKPISPLKETTVNELDNAAKYKYDVKDIGLQGYCASIDSYHYIIPNDNKKTDHNQWLLITGGIHGNEHISERVVTGLIERIRMGKCTPSINLLMIPVVNPSGRETRWKQGIRENANDNDLNRDFVYRTQSESCAIHNYITRFKKKGHNIVGGINFHSGALIVCYQPDSRSFDELDEQEKIVASQSKSLATRYVAIDEEIKHPCKLDTYDSNQRYKETRTVTDGVINGYEWYPATGTFDEYLLREHNIPSICVELAKDKQDFSEFESRLDALCKFVETPLHLDSPTTSMNCVQN